LPALLFLYTTMDKLKSTDAPKTTSINSGKMEGAYESEQDTEGNFVASEKITDVERHANRSADLH
jgi:hypothetical protein